MSIWFNAVLHSHRFYTLALLSINPALHFARLCNKCLHAAQQQLLCDNSLKSSAFGDCLEHTDMSLQAEELTKLVEHNKKKVAEKQLEGLKTELTEMISQDPPVPVDECLAAIKAKKAEFALADSELVKVRAVICSLHTHLCHP